MDKKTLISIIGTFLVTAILATALTTYERGSDALTEDQIETVLKKTMVTTINGETKTYGEALSIINEKQVRMETALQALVAD